MPKMQHLFPETDMIRTKYSRTTKQCVRSSASSGSKLRVSVIKIKNTAEKKSAVFAANNGDVIIEKKRKQRY